MVFGKKKEDKDNDIEVELPPPPPPPEDLSIVITDDLVKTGEIDIGDDEYNTILTRLSERNQEDQGDTVPVDILGEKGLMYNLIDKVFKLRNALEDNINDEEVLDIWIEIADKSILGIIQNEKR